MRASQPLCWFLCNRFVIGRHQDALEQWGKVFLSAAAGVSSGLACAGGKLWHSQSHATLVCSGEGTELCRQAGMCIALRAALGKMTIAGHIQLRLTAWTACTAGSEPTGHMVTNVSTRRRHWHGPRIKTWPLKARVCYSSWAETEAEILNF